MDYDQILVDIARYVYHYEIHNPESYSRARTLLLDSFGCAIASLGDNSVQKLVGPFMPGTIVPNGFRLPGTKIQEDPTKGAFDFGTMIRYLDYNDALGGVEWGHPSDNLGGIVATMDWLSRYHHASGERGNINDQNNGPPLTIRTLLDAMIKAYEIQGCFQIANSFNAVSIDHTILVKVASTAVTAWLMGLSESECLAALSQAWMDGHPLRTFRAVPNVITRKGWAAGDACMRAVHLVLLTKTGQMGAPTPLTAPRWGFYDALFRGKDFTLPVVYGESIIHRTIVKLIACEGHALTAAEAALTLHRQLQDKDLDPSKDIAEVRIRTHKPALIIIDKKGELKNAADRDHCMQYIVAIVLLKGSLIRVQDYQDSSPWASDPQVAALRDKMSIREDEEFTRAYYNYEAPSAPSGILILLKDGTQTDEVVVHVPLGGPGATQRLDGVDIQTKFHENLKGGYSYEEIARLQSALGRDETPVHEYVDLWWRPASTLGRTQ